jgi:alpha-L-rhamnosidase
MCYIRVIVCDSAVDVCDVRVREYAHPVPEPASPFSDSELSAILRAGWQTFRTNSVDLFTDCMSRERGGYPCDSYFTARTELAFVGESRVERNFLENYFLVDTFTSIPEGMVPHCYPSDRLGKGQYIPNWGLWLVLQLGEYCLRTNDEALRGLARSRVEALFDWFAKHRNTQGLLEDIPGWLFVEWSDANNYTDGVSHPTNMLYARCLGAAAELYGRSDWQAASLQTAEAVRQESWDGHWFADQSKRVDGVLQRTTFRSETCQYHALFCKVATPGQAANLWQRLRDDWGPMRGVHGGNDADLLPAELLYGLMLRFDLLQRAGERERLVAELRHVFGPMARQSGTLWEHVAPCASLNHGFASYASALLLA